MRAALVTGGAGFFGDILKQRLLREGWRCISIDLEEDPYTHPELVSVRGDLNDPAAMDRAFAAGPFDAIFHCAAMLAHGGVDKRKLWAANVEGTQSVAERAKAHGVLVVFTSTNCLWGSGLGRPIAEDEPPAPVEVYGRSKWEAEKVLRGYGDALRTVIIRCPTILEAGRLGLLSILFEFIDEGRRLWVVGDGSNRYQFIDAQDLASACLLAADYPSSAVFHIGSDDVKTFREVYQYVIDRARAKARLGFLPKAPMIAAMKVAYWLGLSPLGPYHYRMIAESFQFDTTKIKSALGWRPTVTNEEMLFKAYSYYHAHRGEIESREHASAHRKASRMGAIRLLKLIS